MKTRFQRAFDFRWQTYLKDDFYSFRWATQPTPLWLGVVRGMLGTYMVAWAIVALATYDPQTWFFHFTNFTYSWVCITLLVSSALSFKQHFRPETNEDCESPRSMNKLELVAVVFHSIVMPCSVALDVFYWALLYVPGKPSHPIINFHVHLFNCFIILAAVLVSKFKVKLTHFWFTLLYLAVYLLGLMLPFFFAPFGGRWLYNVLDPTKPLAWGTYPGVVVLFFGIHAAAVLVTSDRLWKKCVPSYGQTPLKEVLTH